MVYQINNKDGRRRRKEKGNGKGTAKNMNANDIRRKRGSEIEKRYSKK